DAGHRPRVPVPLHRRGGRGDFIGVQHADGAIYALSLHDALPIYDHRRRVRPGAVVGVGAGHLEVAAAAADVAGAAGAVAPVDQGGVVAGGAAVVVVGEAADGGGELLAPGDAEGGGHRVQRRLAGV